MPREIAVPPADAQFEQRDAVLLVRARDGRTVAEFRVDDGITFARSPGAGTEAWSDIEPRSVIALFAADSPVAAFLRAQGVNPLRHLLMELGAPSGSGARDAS